MELYVSEYLHFHIKTKLCFSLCFPSAPCAPMNLSTSLVCNNNTGVVSWNPSPGAVSYQVMANGRDGDVKQCTTTNTSCSIPSMHCAQTYVITVTPFSRTCKGFTSYPHTYIAGEVKLEYNTVRFWFGITQYYFI